MKYYRMIYGNGTHGLRVFNFLISAIYLILIVMNLSGDLLLDLPNSLHTINWLPIVLVMTIVTSGLSFFIQGYEGGMFRFLSLALGALSQELIAVRFGSVYPPLDIVFLISTFLAVWFLGGCFYICKDRNNVTNTIGKHTS